MGLETYLTQHKADLLILLPKPHSRLRTWLLESNTQEVARLASLPVLAAVQPLHHPFQLLNRI